MRRAIFLIALGLARVAQPALAQDRGSLEPPVARPARPPGRSFNARQGTVWPRDGPAPLAARTIGFYSRGCLAGGRPLPVNGPAWQVMRLSRNRNWGHPALIAFLERFRAQGADGQPLAGILVGDMSQPRGGPMLTGHASHQIGLDVDVWLTPMPAVS